MNLKRNDKIIAVVGVVILVIAAIGIIFYYSNEDTEEKDTDDEIETFYVQWERKEETGQTITGTSEGEAYMDSITVSAPIGCVLTNVEMTLSFEDDNVWGLIFKKGYDTLDAKITGPSSSNVNELGPMTGEGNETLRIGVYDIPSSMDVEAETEDDAIQQAENEYMDSDSAKFDIEVTVTAGEKFKLLMPIRSLLNTLKDKGDDFDISVKYTYYEPIIEGSDDDDDDDNDETGYKEEGAETYSPLSYPGKN